MTLKTGVMILKIQLCHHEYIMNEYDFKMNTILKCILNRKLCFCNNISQYDLFFMYFCSQFRKKVVQTY